MKRLNHELTKMAFCNHICNWCRGIALFRLLDVNPRFFAVWDIKTITQHDFWYAHRRWELFACNCIMIFIFSRLIMLIFPLKKETTSEERAHRFCTFIVRVKRNHAFGLLIATLNEVKQKHVADELLRIESIGYVYRTGGIEANDKRISWHHVVAETKDYRQWVRHCHSLVIIIFSLFFIHYLPEMIIAWMTRFCLSLTRTRYFKRLFTK